MLIHLGILYLSTFGVVTGEDLADVVTQRTIVSATAIEASIREIEERKSVAGMASAGFMMFAGLVWYV